MTWNRSSIGLCGLLLIWSFFPTFAGEKLSIYAAASMTDVIEKLADKYEIECGCKIAVTIGGSGTLARQIEAGAPADLYISADPRWIGWLQKKLELPEQKLHPMAENGLVIVSRKSLSPSIASMRQLLKIRFAMGEPTSVPAGRYAKEALEKEGIWESVNRSAIRTENVRVALAMVERGVVDAAIVYASDAKLLKGIEVLPVSSEMHSPIQYGVMIVREKRKIVSGFLSFMKSEIARSVLQHHGFQLLQDQ